MKVKVSKLFAEAKLPVYGTDHSACFDLFSTNTETVIIPPRDSYVFGTGLVFEVPICHMMRIYPRSSLGFKYDCQLSNGTGIIDSDYRGEVKIKIINLGNNAVKIEPFSRLVQAEIAPVKRVKFHEIDIAHMSKTDRGEGGFGSTGVK